MRPFRFGYQFRGTSAAELVEAAIKAEAAGFDVFSTADHIGDGWPPLPPLLAAALATTTLRVCPLVINNDLRHPVELARDVLAIDQLTGGRIELGIGAGHSAPEYAARGLAFDSGRVRKARLRESVEILRSLLSGQPTSFDGDFYQLDAVRLQQPHGTHVPPPGCGLRTNRSRPLCSICRHRWLDGSRPDTA
ncbi:MAG: LLM class flavin-dependent oxidoreductase [Acidimicrobiales bacterium]